jgi:hypothetical protein
MKSKILVIFTLVLLSCKNRNSNNTKLSTKDFNSKIENQVYVDDVEIVEVVSLNFCIDNFGNTNNVSLIPDKTTYKNNNNIKSVIEYRKNIKQLPNSKLLNNCYDYNFNFINSKYENKHLETSKYKECEKLKTGFFTYQSILYPNTTIERNNEFQIEKVGKWFSKYKIEWQTPATYTLTYIEVSDKESDYLIGEKIFVEIIDILENGNYVYKSNLLDRTFGFGIISPLN